MTSPDHTPDSVVLLDVGDGHRLHVETHGRPDGIPAVYVHGGPGSGTSPTAWRSFDLDTYRVVLYDQRAAGRSTPHASEVPAVDGGPVDWDSIDLKHHVADLERVRTALGIEAWLVFGVSWGSGLAAAYAETHPDRVTELVLAAVGLGTTPEIEWLTVHAGRFLPDHWARFAAHVPPELAGQRLVEAYRSLLFDPDPQVHHAAAVAWCRWEDAHMAAAAGPTGGLMGDAAEAWTDPRYADPRFRLGFARQVTHAWSRDWFDPDRLVAGADRLTGIPGWLVHGRLDVSSPVDAPWRLHRAWPGSELVVVDGEGHGGASMAATWRRVIAEDVPARRSGTQR